MVKKSRYFIKFDPRINKLTGCQKATLILGSLEYWFAKKPDGFYKFMEPCSHRLYKKGDSWAEELGLERRCFARSFQKIGVKYNSRIAFEQAEDKFQGKMYASYYDRYSNQTFFIRNHDLANDILKGFSTEKSTNAQKDTPPSKPLVSVPDLPLSIGHSGLSYMEAKNTTKDLSKDKSHASNEIVKKMIDVWTAIVEGGKGQLELTNKRIAFMKQAFVDKFDSCLEKWKKYCESIASSRFLMGEIKSSFKVTLDWALKFETIQKILEGCYGIGDRALVFPVPAPEFIEEQISSLNEPECLKEFRSRCLHQFGVNTYISWFKNIILGLEGNALFLTAQNSFVADHIGRTFYTSLRVLLEGSDQGISSLLVCVQGELKERLRIEREEKPDPSLSEPNQVLDQEQLAGQGVRTTEAPLEDKAEQEMESAADLSTPSCFSEISEVFEEEITPVGQAIRIPDREGATDILTTAQNSTVNLLASLSKMAFQSLPSWLLRLKVDSFKPDGELVVLLDDPFTVDYARSFHAEQILVAARQLWPDVKSLSIQSPRNCQDIEEVDKEISEKNKAPLSKPRCSADRVPFPSQNIWIYPSKNKVKPNENRLEQALQSLLLASVETGAGRDFNPSLLK